MSRWNGRGTSLTPELIDLVQQIHRLRASLPTWEQLEQVTGVKANTLRGVAIGRVPKRVLRSAAKIPT